MGDSSQVLKQLADGTHEFNNTLATAKKPLIILGAQQLTRSDGGAILAQVQKLARALSLNTQVLLTNIALRLEFNRGTTLLVYIL